MPIRDWNPIARRDEPAPVPVSAPGLLVTELATAHLDSEWTRLTA